MCKQVSDQGTPREVPVPSAQVDDAGGKLDPYSLPQYFHRPGFLRQWDGRRRLLQRHGEQ